MKALDIITQLATKLPFYTDYFTDSTEVLSLTFSGGIVTGVTVVPHLLTLGDYIIVKGANSPVQLSSLTQVDNIATGITINNHDLTENYNNFNGSQNAIARISGADQSEYEGDNDLLTVPNRKTFTCKISGDPVSPATGTIFLFDGKDRGYIGLKQVTVVDPVTITYPISETPETPAGGDITFKSNIRISGAASLERAIESYTKKATDKYWAFVVLGNTSSSKSRHVMNDSVSTLSPGDDYRVRLIKQFSVFVFAPTVSAISGRSQRDTMIDVEVALYKSLLGKKFNSSFTTQERFQIVPVSNEMVLYNTAYMVHEFIFETDFDVTYFDTVEGDRNVAFRDMSFDFDNDVELGVNLDDEPL